MVADPNCLPAGEPPTDAAQQEFDRIRRSRQPQ